MIKEMQSSFHVRSMIPDDLPMIIDLQSRYISRYPDAAMVQGETYRVQSFAGGGEFFCASNQEGQILGYASLILSPVLDGPPNLNHILWAEIKVDPDLLVCDPVFDSLLDVLIEHSKRLVQQLPTRSAQLVFQNYPSETETIRILQQRGFVHTESIYQLSRDLSLPIPVVLAPPSMQIVSWRMESTEEQLQYVQARNQAFPEAAITLDDWKQFMDSPLWEVGTCLAVFDGKELAGCITLYWDAVHNQLSDHSVGYTEYIFVLPRWRGLGLGTLLVSNGLAFLKKHGLAEAQLEVKAANVGALGLYSRLGYRVKRESWFLENTL